jgi:hypothetical protein
MMINKITIILTLLITASIGTQINAEPVSSLRGAIDIDEDSSVPAAKNTTRMKSLSHAITYSNRH